MDSFNEARERLAEDQEEEHRLIDEFMAENELKSQDQRGNFKHLYWQIYQYQENKYNDVPMDFKLRHVFDEYNKRHNPMLWSFHQFQKILEKKDKKEGNEGNKIKESEGDKKSVNEHIKDLLTGMIDGCLSKLVDRFAPFRK